jgi:hypothetical protein
MQAYHKVSIAELLRGAPIEWPKPEEHFDVMKHIDKHDGRIIFEDEYVVSFEIDEDDREGKKDPGERRITIAPKRKVESLLDLGTADTLLSAHLLFGIQQTAYKLGLHHTGFEIRFNVLPPYQRRPHFSMRIRTGDPRKGKAPKPDASV